MATSSTPEERIQMLTLLLNGERELRLAAEQREAALRQQVLALKAQPSEDQIIEQSRKRAEAMMGGLNQTISNQHDTIMAQAKSLGELVRRCRMMAAALGYYADENVYEGYRGYGRRPMSMWMNPNPPVDRDLGARARTVLKECNFLTDNGPVVPSVLTQVVEKELVRIVPGLEFKK